MAGYEQRKHAVRRWKFENPQDGQVQSPGRGRFLLGGKGVSISAARSRMRLDDGETSIAFSLRARPFMHRDSAACYALAMSTVPCRSSWWQVGIHISYECESNLPLHGKKRLRSRCQWACAGPECVVSRRRLGDLRTE